MLTAAADRDVLKRLGFTVSEPEAGCCGMAGAFGFEERHLPVAQALGERALLPAIRSAAPGTAIIADGFSCREQIRQGANQRALHLAEVIKQAFKL